MFKVQAFALLSYIVQQPGSALGEGYRAEDVAGSPSDSNSLFSKKHLVPMRDVTLQAGPFDRNNLKSLPATAALLEVLAVPDAPSAAGGRGPPQIPTALLEGALENLAKETLKGTSDVSNATRASLAAIISAMDDIIADGLRLHIEDQWEVDQAREEISNCSVDTSQNKDYASRTEAAEDSHDTCRENQSVTRKHKLQKCSAYEDYVASASPLQVCPVSTPTTPAELEAVLEWAEGYRGEYWTYKASCETATEEYGNQTNTCYTQQAAFESAFCEYHMQLTGSCDSYASCYSRTTNHFAEVTRSVNTSAILRKHEHLSAKKVQCFVKVLNASDEVQGAMLENCLVDFVVDDSMLDILFPQIPEEIVCSTAPVADPPCTGGFLSSHYEGKVWYDGAMTGSCHVCPHLTSPTAITTPAPTTAPTHGNYDDFSTDLGAWSSENLGAGEENWFIESGYVRETANKYSGGYCAGDAIGAALVYKKGWYKQFTMTTDIRNEDDDGVGLVWGFVDNSNYWFFRVLRDGGGCKQIIKVVSGTQSIVTTVSGNYVCASGSYCKYEVSQDSNGVNVYQDGVLFLSTEESSSAGQVGLYSWGNSAGYFGNFEVTGTAS